MAISSALGSSALLPAGLGFRNRIINGGFDVWQRSTSAAIGAGSYVAADRWYTYRSVAGSTFSRQTASLVGFQYSGRIARDSANTSTVNISCGQSIESNNSIPLAGQTVVFSFWAKAGANYSATSNILRVRLLSSTTTNQNIVLNGGVTVIDQNATLTTSWQRFSYSAVVGSSAVTLGTIFSYDPTGTAGAADNFEITGVQLEQNYQPTPFEQRPIGVELALCQRYYCVVASGSSFVGNAVMHTADAFESIIHLPTVMRTAPTLVATTGASYYGIYALNVTKRVDLLTNASNNLSNLRIYGSLVSTTSTAGVGAGLYLQSASASIAASSEL
jgi:hypothetical protein